MQSVVINLSRTRIVGDRWKTNTSKKIKVEKTMKQFLIWTVDTMKNCLFFLARACVTISSNSCFPSILKSLKVLDRKKRILNIFFYSFQPILECINALKIEVVVAHVTLKNSRWGQKHEDWFDFILIKNTLRWNVFEKLAEIDALNLVSLRLWRKVGALEIKTLPLRWQKKRLGGF